MITRKANGLPNHPAGRFQLRKERVRTFLAASAASFITAFEVLLHIFQDHA
jgi:hypothetical protein